MRSYLTDFNDLAAVEADQAKQTTLDGFHLAAAGISTGRNINFLTQFDEHNGLNARSKKSGADDVMGAILTALSYDELLSQTYTRLREVQSIVDRALDIATQRFDEEHRKLADLEDRAATLPNGTKVAIDKNGDVRTLDGVLVDPALAAGVQFTPDHPSFEEITAQQDRTDAALEVLEQVREDEQKLGDLHEALEGQPSRQAIEDIQSEIEAIGERNEALIKQAPESHASLSQPTANSFELPVIGS